MSIDSYVKDVTNHSYMICGKMFAGDVTQIVKQNNDGTDAQLEHSFYSVDDDGVVKRLGAFTFGENSEGSISMDFYVTDSVTGESTSVLGVGSDGLTVTGGIEVVGGSTTFDTSSISVADIDITLGSGAETISDIDTGGIVLGTTESGEKTIRFSVNMESWTSNVGFNVETGKAFTVNEDSVVLDESGLTIDDIVLSNSGLNIGTDVELNATSLTIGSTDPVILDSSGLVVGSSLSLDTTNGLLVGDIKLNSTDGLVVGTDISLNSTNGLVIGTDIVLNVSGGLSLGDINLSTLGLFLGTDLELSLANGLVLENVTMTNSALTYESTTGDVVMNEQGLYVGDEISLTKSGGLTLGTSATLDLTSISFGTSPDESVLDDTSLSLGSDILLNHDGLYMPNTTAAIYMGDTNQWKISFDASSENLKFEYYDSTTDSYVVKMELKSSD